jgi:hypothetical protein
MGITTKRFPSSRPIIRSKLIPESDPSEARRLNRHRQAEIKGRAAEIIFLESSPAEAQSGATARTEARHQRDQPAFRYLPVVEPCGLPAGAKAWG